MTSILKKDRKHASDSYTKLNVFARDLKQCVLQESIENSFQKLTKSYIKKDLFVIWQKSWILHKKVFHTCGLMVKNMFSPRMYLRQGRSCFSNSK